MQASNADVFLDPATVRACMIDYRPHSAGIHTVKPLASDTVPQLRWVPQTLTLAQILYAPPFVVTHLPWAFLVLVPGIIGDNSVLI